MNNEFNNMNSSTGTDSDAQVTSSVPTVNEPPIESHPAFEYQPPAVDIPQPPTFANQPTIAEVLTQRETTPQETAPQQPTQQAVPQQNPYQQTPQQSYSYTAQQNAYQQLPTQPTYPQQPVQQAYPQQNPYQQQAQTASYYQYTPTYPVATQQSSTDGYAIASLILSIVGMVACCTFVPSILGVIFGIVSKSKNDGTRPTGVSTAGIVIGIIGILWNLLWTSAMMSS